MTGAFGTPQSFYDEVMAAADRAGERYWQLPLVDEYRKDLDSWTGDIQNSGTVEASLVKSGLFLREFVTKPWVHLDIAGTAYFRKALPFAPKGATGVAHATLVELALAGAPARLTAATTGTSRHPQTEPGPRRRSQWICCRASSGWRALPSVSPPTGSRPAGRSTTRSIRPGAGSTGGPASSPSSVPLAFGLLPIRFGGDPVAFAVFGAWFVTLVVGLATDLDQRLLPDLLTLPVIPVALVYALTGSNPFVGSDIVPAVLAAVVIPAALYLPSIPFGAGAFGMGDVKLLAGVGLLAGGERALGSVVFALVLSGVVLITLLATRRIGRRTYVPFGPFFIIGALWAVLIRP